MFYPKKRQTLSFNIQSKQPVQTPCPILSWSLMIRCWLVILGPPTSGPHQNSDVHSPGPAHPQVITILMGDFFYHPQMVGFWHWVAHIIFDRDIYNQGTCWHVGLPPRFHHLWWLIYPHSPHFIVISHIFQYIMLFHCARWHACYRLLSFINAL